MRLGNEAKVGLIVFTAFLALVAIYWFLGSFGLRTSTYQIYAIFPNVQKLDKGADVRMAGVKIGVVSEVLLTPNSQARVNMLINNTNVIPSDSVATITSGAVIGDSFVAIVPGSSKIPLKPGSRLKILKVVQFDEIMANAGALITDLRTATRSVNEVLGDKKLVESIKASVVELQKTAESASLLMSSAQGLVTQTSPQINRVFGNLTIATENAIKVSQDIEQLVEQDARPNISAILTQARLASEGLNQSIKDAQALIASFTGGSDKIMATLDKVDATVAQAQQMMANLNEASAGLKELATDKDIKNDLKTTIKNAAEASTSLKDLATDQELKKNLKTTIRNTAEITEQTKNLVGKLGGVFGGARTGPSAQKKAAITDYGTSTDLLWNTTEGKYRADLNYTFGGLGKSFYRVGMYDLGEKNRVNLQSGQIVDPLTNVRYGLYASKLGIGLDKTLVPGFRLSADLYRPNRPQLELRGILNVSGPFAINAGIKNDFKGENDVLVGVHYVK